MEELDAIPSFQNERYTTTLQLGKTMRDLIDKLLVRILWGVKGDAAQPKEAMAVPK
jgi:hypothetical protein